MNAVVDAARSREPVDADKILSVPGTARAL
jgi:hypothetical protein